MDFLKNSIPTIILVFSIHIAIGQITISGTVKERNGTPIPLANVYLTETSYGSSTDSSGTFSFIVPLKGNKVLAVTSIGFEAYERGIVLANTDLTFTIILQSNSTQLGGVVVSAGAFEASDKAKGASLTPMDAVTVAGNGADVAMSLRALPGSQQVGEREGLFVRGGTGEESKQFIDGLLIHKPNYSSVPGMPQPAHVNPFLFKGILFSTGGYSALYGQALSSALVMETVDLPEESEAGFHIFPTNSGVGIQKLLPNKKSSYGVNSSYGNHAFYNSIVTQKPDYFQGPEYFDVDANFRIKTSETGMLKMYTNYALSHIGMRNPDIDSTALKNSFELKNRNIYANVSYQEFLGDDWKINTGLAYNYNQDRIENQLQDTENEQLFLEGAAFSVKNNAFHGQTNLTQVRVVFSRFLHDNQALRFGTEYFYTKDKFSFNDNSLPIEDQLSATFAEGDIYLGSNMAAKVGLRFEYSSLLKETNFAPRAGLAYRFNDGGQLNLAYGILYQKPDTRFLIENPDLDFSRADHYILNYQKKGNNRFFRTEVYYKKYDGLITTTPSPANQGDGYAKGFELFWRDKKTIKDLDYWITYTYLDTERRFLNYPSPLRPSFTTPHTATLAVKKYFQEIKLNVNAAYTITSGRPYYYFDPVAAGSQQLVDRGTTPTYSGLNLSLAYLTTFFKKWKDFSGIGMGVNNVFGNRQVFGYNYSYNGSNKTAITLPAVSSIYLGVFIGFGTDRTDDFLNDYL